MSFPFSTSTSTAPRAGGTSSNFHSKSHHTAYGTDFTVVAYGPPHALVFQSFLNDDLSSKPVVTETTKRQCIMQTAAFLAPAIRGATLQSSGTTSSTSSEPIRELEVFERQPAPPGGRTSVTLPCRHCNGVNTYYILVLAIITLLTLPVITHAQWPAPPYPDSTVFSAPMTADVMTFDCKAFGGGVTYAAGESAEWSAIRSPFWQGPDFHNPLRNHIDSLGIQNGDTVCLDYKYTLNCENKVGCRAWLLYMNIDIQGGAPPTQTVKTVNWLGQVSTSDVAYFDSAYVSNSGTFCTPWYADVTHGEGQVWGYCSSTGDGLAWAYFNVAARRGEPLTSTAIQVTIVGQSEPLNVSAIAIQPGQVVIINDTVPVNTNVTSLLGQLANAAKVCTNGDGGTYTCIEPRLVDVLPPDMAVGPDYLGAAQQYYWSNFTGARFPNFRPNQPSPISHPQHNPNDFTPEENELMASLFVSIRRRKVQTGTVKGYLEYLAREHNKHQHSNNGNIASMTDAEFEAYCIEKAQRYGSLYQYVFNELAFDTPIPDTCFVGISAEPPDRGMVDVDPSVLDNDIPRTKPSRRSMPGNSSERPIPSYARKAPKVSSPAPRRNISPQQYVDSVIRIASTISNWHDLLLYTLRHRGCSLIHFQRIYHQLKLVDDGSADAGLVCLMLADDGFPDLVKLRLLTDRAASELHFQFVSSPLLNSIANVSGYEAVCQAHLNKMMHSLVGNGNKNQQVDINDNKSEVVPRHLQQVHLVGGRAAPVRNTHIYVDPREPDSDHLINWVTQMDLFSVYYMVGNRYAANSAEMFRILSDMESFVMISAHVRLRGGMMTTDTESVTPERSAPATPTPTESGINNVGASKPKDGIDDRKEAPLPTADLVTTAMTNLFSAAADWQSALFYTTVNDLPGLIRRYAQSIKLTSSMFNNVGYKSCMNNYGMYYANFFTGDLGGGEVFGSSYTSVDPSGPGNTSISYSKAGEDLVVAIQTNNMLQVSQNLRISTVPVNGTALYQAMTDSRNLVSCGLTGSFSSVFYRIFANIYSMIPMVGCEHSPVVANTHIVLPNPLVMTWDTLYWPLSPVNNGALPAINCRICTYSEFTAGRFGNVQFADPAFGPTGYSWGSTTAVVPVTLDMLNAQRGAVVAAWILAHMEYPWRHIYHTTTMVHDDNTAAVEWQTFGGHSYPAITYSRCRGPTSNVLLVISGMNTTANALQGVSVTVGVGGAAVAVSLTNNFAVGAAGGGAAVDIAPGLDTIYNNANPNSQTWLETLNTAYIMYGNEPDIRTALIAVADSGTRVAPPAVTSSGLNIYGYKLNDSIAWNTTGLTSVNDAFVPLDGITCPLTMATTTAINEIRSSSMCVMRIGQFNPLIAVDMVNGMYRPSVPASNLFPQSTAAIASCISRMSKMLTVVGDQSIRMAGIPMNFLFNPNAARNLSAGNVNVLSVWKAIYDGINRLLDTQTGGGITFLGSWFADYNTTYWATFNTRWDAVVAVGRVPNFYMETAGIHWEAYAPDGAKTMTFGEYDATNFGYPNVDQPYERILAPAPPPSKTLSAYDILSRLSPMFPNYNVREPLEDIMMAKGGASVTPIGWVNMYPSVGRSPTLTLQNYGIVSYARADTVDPPMDGTLPIFNPKINNEIYPGFYGNSYGYYTRAPQVKYNKHEIARDDYMAYTIMQNASGAPGLQSRLTQLSGGPKN